jgi:hypothetical protein
MPRTKKTRPAKRTKPKDVEPKLKTILKRDLKPALEMIKTGAKKLAGDRNYLTQKEYETISEDARQLISFLEVFTLEETKTTYPSEREIAIPLLEHLRNLKKTNVSIKDHGGTCILKRGRNTVQLQWVYRVVNDIIKHVKL